MDPVEERSLTEQVIHHQYQYKGVELLLLLLLLLISCPLDMQLKTLG